eukprot:749879-Hanusia_phi.AAC.4
MLFLLCEDQVANVRFCEEGEKGGRTRIRRMEMLSRRNEEEMQELEGRGAGYGKLSNFTIRFRRKEGKEGGGRREEGGGRGAAGEQGDEMYERADEGGKEGMGWGQIMGRREGGEESGVERERERKECEGGRERREETRSIASCLWIQEE